MNVNSGGNLNVNSGGAVKVKSGADLNVESGGDINVASGGNVNVNSGGKIKVKSGADLDVESGGDINIASGGKINVQSGGSIGLESGGNFTINSGGTFSVASGGALSIASGGQLSIASGGAFEIASGGTFTIKSGGKLTLATSNSLVISSGNFQIDASGNVTITGTFNSGHWKLYSDGLQYTNGNNVFKIRNSDGTEYGEDANLIDIWSFNSIALTPQSGTLGTIKIDTAALNQYVQLLAIEPYAASGYMTSVGSPNEAFSYGYINTIINGSSRTIKHDIKDLPDNGEEIDALRPVSFIYNKDPLSAKRYGLIYEEAKEVLPDICFTGDKPEQCGINYMDLVPVLLKEIQSLRKRVSELEKKGV
jgi:hypothetical protein